jgi:hypothetical protein
MQSSMNWWAALLENVPSTISSVVSVRSLEVGLSKAAELVRGIRVDIADLRYGLAVQRFM